MKSLFVTGHEYQLLQTKCAAWMGLRWASFSRSWCPGGVVVTGKEHEIENLKYQLLSIKD